MIILFTSGTATITGSPADRTCRIQQSLSLRDPAGEPGHLPVLCKPISMKKKKVKPKKKITLAELAAFLHLSPSTVSQALNGHPKVKPATRAYVAAAAGYKGYFKKNIVAADPLTNGRVTMRDLANRLNISACTVCRALQRSETVSPKTTAKVLAAAAEMGYELNNNARNLVARNSEKNGSSKPTIYTIAKTLRISPSTVSRAFSPTASVAPATRERIFRQAAKVKFSPDPDAAALKAGHDPENLPAKPSANRGASGQPAVKADKLPGLPIT